MGYKIEFNTILSVKDSLDMTDLEVGKIYPTTKEGERLFPLNVPIDLCGQDYKFIAKVAVRSLKITRNCTELEFEVLKIYSPAESQIISDNFAKEA